MTVIIWIILLVVFLIVEALTAQLTTIWFAAGSLAAIVADLFNAPVVAQFLIFLAVSFVLLISTRKLAKKLSNGEHNRTNADRAIGQEGVVTEEIDNLNAKGLVSLDGSVWTARSSDGSIVPKGETVTAVRIEGVKLIVNKKEKGE